MKKNNKFNSLKILDEFFCDDSDGVLIADPKTRKFIYANDKISDILGYAKEELLEMSVSDIHKPVDMARVNEEFKLAYYDKEKIAKKLPTLRRDGQIIFCDISEMKTKIGNKEYLIGIFRVAEGDAIFAEKDKFINEMSSSFFLLDLEGNILLINEAGAYNFGGKAGDFISKSFYDFMPEVELFIKKRWDSIIKKGEIGEFETELLMPTGELKDFWTIIKPLRDRKNKVFALEVVSYDLIEHEAASKILRGKELVGSDKFDGSVIAMFVIDKNHKVIHWNKALEKISGYSASEMMGKSSPWKPFYKKKRPVLADLLLEGKKIREIEGWYNHNQKVFTKKSEFIGGAIQGLDFFPDMGERGKWLFFMADVIRNEQGKVIGAIEIIEDVTEKKRTQNELKKSEVRYRRLFETAKDAILILDAESGKIIDSNPFIQDLLGYSAEELIGKKVWEISPLKDIWKNKSKFKELQKNRYVRYENLPLETKNGIVRYVEFVANVYPVEGVSVVQCNVRDISERVIAEEKLIENEKRFRDLYENLPGSAYRCANDEHLTMKFISNAVKDITGYTPDEFINNKKISFEKIIYPEDRGMVKYAIKRAIKEGKSFEVEYRIITKNGKIKWLLERGKAVTGKVGKIKYIDGLHFDISERKKNEEELKKEKYLTESYLGLVGVMIVVLDYKGEIMMINKKGEEILEGKEWELVGKNWFRNFVPPENRREIKTIFDKLFAGEAEVVRYHENEIITSSGKRRIISWHNSVIKNEKGEIISLISSGEDVTEKRQIQKKLADNEKKYRTLVEFASDTILYIDTQGIIIEANKAMERLMGYEKKYVVGKHINELTNMVPPGSMKTIVDNFRRRLAGEKVGPYVVTMISKEREERLFEITASVIKDDGKTVGVFSILHDVTERERSRKILQDSEQKFRTLFETANDAIFIMKGERFIDCNKRTLEIFECERLQIIGRTIHHFSPRLQPSGRDSKSEIRNKIDAALSGQPQFFEWVNIKYNQTSFAAEISLNRIFIKNNFYIQAIVRDISERKKTEDKLKTSEQRFRDITFSSGDIIWEVDKSFKFNFVSGNPEKLIQYTANEMLGKTFYDFIKKDEVEGIKKKVDKIVIKRKPIVDLENTRLSREKVYYTFLTNGVPIYSETGEYLGYRGIDKNITKRKLAEEEVKISGEKLKTVVENIGDGVFVLDCDYKVLMFNQQAQRISGFSKKEVVGRLYNKILRFIFEGSGKINHDFVRQCIKNGKVIEAHNHTQLIRKDGTKVVISYSSSPLRDKNKKVIGCVVVFRDISKETEIDRMKSEFISVASHQLKTPLSGIKWFTELLLRGKVGELNSKQKDFIEQIRTSNERLVSLVSDLLNVSHIETGRKFDVAKGKVDACKVVNRVLEASMPSMRKLKVKVVKEESCKKSFNILADEEKIQQVFFNLVTNAIKYSHENGKIFIGTKSEDDKVIFFVRDEGIGIDAKDFDRVFTKFFRGDNALKTETDGTGLGLYIAKAIVEAHGGKIWFESKLGEGSTFYFSIKKYK